MYLLILVCDPYSSIYSGNAYCSEGGVTSIPSPAYDHLEHHKPHRPYWTLGRNWHPCWYLDGTSKLVCDTCSRKLHRSINLEDAWNFRWAWKKESEWATTYALRTCKSSAFLHRHNSGQRGSMLLRLQLFFTRITCSTSELSFSLKATNLVIPRTS